MPLEMTMMHVAFVRVLVVVKRLLINGPSNCDHLLGIDEHSLCHPQIRHGKAVAKGY